MASNVYINDRTIYLHGEINSENIGELNVSLLALIGLDDDIEKEKINFEREPINLYINTRGGSVDDMWSLIDIINSSRTPIYTYCVGYAYSAGFMIFISGKKRFISNHATLLYHQLSHTISGNHTSNKQQLEEDENTYKEMMEYVLEKTKINKKKLEEINKTKSDWIMRKDEAIKLGVADAIIKEL